MAQHDLHGRLLRLVMPHGVYEWMEWAPDSSSWLSRNRGRLQPEILKRGYPVAVRPHRSRAHFLVLDIDIGSAYHPAQNPSAIDQICGLLAHQGIERLLRVRSSDSGGLHLWAPLPGQSTGALARWLEQCITAAGFHVANGHLELFPNLAKLGSSYKGIRLPLIAPDSWILDDDLNPVQQSIERLCDDWTACLACNEEFAVGLAAAPPPPQAVRGGRPAEAWERLNRGWSGHGQTWDLAHDAAFIATCEGLRGAALQSRMCKLMAVAPGCQAWSKHWKEIASGKYGSGLAKYYSKIGADYAASRKQGSSELKAPKKKRDPLYNQKQSDQRRSSLELVVKDLEDAGERFPNPTAAIHRLIESLKEKTGMGMSKTTIYKQHMGLVQRLVKF